MLQCLSNDNLEILAAEVQKTIQPVFTSRKLKQDISLREPKPNIVTQQCVVHLFNCDLCGAGHGYVGSRCRAHKGPPSHAR